MIRSTPRRFNVAPVILIGLMLPLLFISACCGGATKGDALGGTVKTLDPQAEEIHFVNGHTILEGTLFWPGAKTNCPAVVILAGSDRSKRGPLRTRIAKHFAAHNVAALVYDSPGTGASTGTAIFQTRRDRVIEALSAVDYLREVPGIRSTAVGLFGGSEGADVALLAAAEAPHVAFVIAVSGAMGVSILDVLRYSAEKKGHQQDLTLDETMKAITFKEIAFVFLSGIEIVEWSLIEARVKQWKEDNWTTLIGLAKQRNRKQSQQQQQAMLSSFRQVIDQFKNQRWFSSVDDGNAIQRMANLDADKFFKILEGGRYTQDWDRGLCDVARIRCPVLAIWGLEDSFLPPNQSAMRLKKALAESNHPDYEIKVFPNASHTLTVPGSATEFVPGYLETMTHWLEMHVDSGGVGEP